MKGCILTLEKVLLFDLDGTLLRSDKTISPYTTKVLQKCRERGLILGIATARSEMNARRFISAVNPEIVVSSNGALVSFKGKGVYRCEFSKEDTKTIIDTAIAALGGDCEITVDTADKHYWNYKVFPLDIDISWGETTYTDYSRFYENALKICIGINDEKLASQIAGSVGDCSYFKFSDGDWFQFSRKSATKENAVSELSKVMGIGASDITAFGDDFIDIKMLTVCGKGVAVGNAIKEVKKIADVVIDTNDNDGIAKYLFDVYNL